MLFRSVYGTSIMPEAVLCRALARLPKVRFIQSYGMTELSPAATVLPPKYHVLEGPLAGKIKSIGQPIPLIAKCRTAKSKCADRWSCKVIGNNPN